MATVCSEAERVRDHNRPVCRPLAKVIDVPQLKTLPGIFRCIATGRSSCLKKTLNASESTPCGHLPESGGKCQTVWVGTLVANTNPLHGPQRRSNDRHVSRERGYTCQNVKTRLLHYLHSTNSKLANESPHYSTQRNYFDSNDNIVWYDKFQERVLWLRKLLPELIP